MPKSIKVGAHVYTVLRKSKGQMSGVGECDFDGTQILVRKRLKKSVAKETLLHELLHACIYPSFNDKSTTDEEFVLALAPVLLQVIQDNPDLLEYLTQ